MTAELKNSGLRLWDQGLRLKGCRMAGEAPWAQRIDLKNSSEDSGLGNSW